MTRSVAFFACLAYASVFRAVDTLSLIRDTGRARRCCNASTWVSAS